MYVVAVVGGGGLVTGVEVGAVRTIISTGMVLTGAIVDALSLGIDSSIVR